MQLNRDTMTNDREFPLLPAGTYRFEVVNVVRAMSAAGNDMYQLRIKCTNDAGNSGNVFDNLVETEKCGWKFIQFFDSIGMDTDDTESVMNTIGEVGKVQIKVEQRPGYNDRNVVDRYLPAQKPEVPAKPIPAVKRKKPSAPKAEALPESSDDLPF